MADWMNFLALAMTVASSNTRLIDLGRGGWIAVEVRALGLRSERHDTPRATPMTDDGHVRRPWNGFQGLEVKGLLEPLAVAVGQSALLLLTAPSTLAGTAVVGRTALGDDRALARSDLGAPASTGIGLAVRSLLGLRGTGLVHGLRGRTVSVALHDWEIL